LVAPAVGDTSANLLGVELGGRYRLEHLIARGGSGSVFAGFDKVMERRVAIKVLATNEDDPARQGRLEGEARINGALPHPNVVAAFDIGQHEGRPFIVTELLEGATLRAKLTEGPIPAAKALDYALQLANGLAAAHEKGVVHCDLKPENVFVTGDGWIKIFDFGIARVHRVDQTASEEPSDEGQSGFAGTSGYAAPEQLDGGEPEPRWDVFAFGAVAWEMLAGKRAFPGATREERREATRKANPGKLPASVPARLRAVVEKCLSLDRAQRYASGKELVAALSQVRRKRTQELRAAAIAAVVILLAVAGVAYVRAPGKPTELAFRQITFHPGAVWTARFSPDGQRVWYTETWDGSPARIFSTGTDEKQSQRLEIDHAVLAGMSASGQIAILEQPHFENYDYSGTLAVAPAPGSAAREVQTQVDYADLTADASNMVIVHREGSTARLEFPRGKVLVEGRGWFGHPRLSPKGDYIAYFEHPRVSEADGALCVVSTSGERRELVSKLRNAEGLAWSPSGDEIWFTATVPGQGSQPALRAVTLSGAMRLLARAPGNLKLQDVAPDGRVLATQPQNYLGLTLSDRDGQDRDLSWLDQPVLYDLTPDGSKLLFGVLLGAGNVGPLYVRGTDGGPPIQLGQGLTGAISHDGRWVAATSVQGPLLPIKILPTGPGAPRELPAAGLTALRARFFPDGKRLLVFAEGLGTGPRLYIRDLDGGEPKAISDEGIVHHWFDISPDGTRVVAARVDGATLLLDPAVTLPPRQVQGPHTGEVPYCWLDDHEVLMGVPVELPARLFAVNVDTGERRPWSSVMPRAPGAFGMARILAAQNGKMLAYNYASAKTHLYLVEGIR
ncbi:MAG: protein kinase, partial [Deltaproteobacteria bacterium]|nr:protein kinase [Deltaproteobacteria bacterium]